MSDHWENIQVIAKEVNNGALSASSMVEKALSNIHKHSEFNAIVSTVETRARQRALLVDSQVKKGKKTGRLAGVPFIAKDNFLTFGSETTAASNILKGFTAPYQATAIEKLEAEGAICVAKANLDAFAHGSSTENSDFMTTKNPHNKKLVPGGSSGGSAAAVVLNMAPFALGTDTGGSIRLPASFCGAVGYKPTYGLVSRSGVVAMASSTDVVGPITKNVEDAALVLDVMSGKDKLDATSVERNASTYLIDDKQSLDGAKIGVVKEYFDNGLDKGVESLIKKAITTAREAGAKIVDVSLPSLPLSLACYYIIMPAEVSSNLSRYDGQRFGYTSTKGKTLDDSYSWSRSEGFGKEAKRRIIIGTYVLSSGYYDAYYKKAQQLRTKLIDETNKAFEDVDFLIGPTTPSTAFRIGQHAADPLQMYLTDIMTVGANLTGIPSISIPAGMANDMPVGLQLLAPQHRDKELLQLSSNLEGLL
jgi:aspartyl-tRNA(Asn)/glutamyl-tRNA(Gln) amidotransferase subunit A